MFLFFDYVARIDNVVEMTSLAQEAHDTADDLDVDVAQHDPDDVDVAQDDQDDAAEDDTDSSLVAFRALADSAAKGKGLVSSSS